MENWWSKKTWKSWLKEFCDKEGVTADWIPAQELYPGKQPPTFHSKISIAFDGEILKAEGTAKTKKDAEQEASRIMIQEKFSYEMREKLNPCSKRRVLLLNESDPVSTIKMMCDKRKLSQPLYTVEKTVGDPHMRTFTVACEISSLGISSNGTGRSKQEAKKDAAMKAVMKLKEQDNLEDSGSETNFTNNYDNTSVEDVAEELQNLPLSPEPKNKVALDNSVLKMLPVEEPENDKFVSQFKNDFKIVECLGAGGFGKVYKAKKLFDGRTYAVKRIPIPSGDRAKRKVLKEVQALAQLEHPNIVRYFNAWIEDPPAGWTEKHGTQIEMYQNTAGTALSEYASSKSTYGSESANMYLYIQQELCEVGNYKTLKDWLWSQERRNPRLVFKNFLGITQAVEYIHSNGIIHRDLKPSNVYITGKPENFNVKLGDFGLATTAYSNLVPDSTVSLGASSMSSTADIGTLLYISPEQLNHPRTPEAYNKKVDIYSMGIIFFELLIPFNTEVERVSVLEALRKQTFPPVFLKKHKDEHDIIRQMLSEFPNDRPNAEKIKDWVNDRLKNWI